MGINRSSLGVVSIVPEPRRNLRQCKNVVYPTQPWYEVIEKILDSKFVISSSLHGIIIAEAFGIPARLLKITDKEPLFKYADYYYGTGRFDFQAATSVAQAWKWAQRNRLSVI